MCSAAEVSDVDEIIENWERIKREEKSRGSAMDGIALSQPALSLAAKILSRARRAGVAVPVPARQEPIDDGARLGVALLALVRLADERGFDAEAELRRLSLTLLAKIRDSEAAQG
jgi:XTP/dITP diphosphohydrolase